MRKSILALAIAGCVIQIGYNAVGLINAPASGLPQELILPGNDLAVYFKAGEAVEQGRSPYVTQAWTDTAVYHYSPTAAWLIAQVSRAATAIGGRLPFRLLAYLYLAVIVVALPIAWRVWRDVFRLFLPHAASVMVAWLPVWLIYSQWFADQYFLNIYTLLMILSGALLSAVARERTELAVFLAVLILQTKPHYAFALLFPAVVGRWRYFARLAIGVAVAYVVVAGATILAVGPTYGLALYGDYARFLVSIRANYPWASFYLGYNHSWYSIFHWLFGIRDWVSVAVTGIRAVSLLPAAWLIWRLWRAPPANRPVAALGLILALHLWSMTLLDQLWEVSLAIVAFMFLLMTTSATQRRLAIFIGVAFSLLGLAQLAGWGLAALVGRPIDQLDPTTRLPLIMASALGLYGLLLAAVGRLLRHEKASSPGSA